MRFRRALTRLVERGGPHQVGGPLDPTAFPGARGVFSFAADGQPINKPAAILSVPPDGAIKFEQVSYPNGTACIPDSTYC